MLNFREIVESRVSEQSDENLLTRIYPVPSGDPKNPYNFAILVTRISCATQELAEKELCRYQLAQNNPHDHICPILRCCREPNCGQYFVFVVHPALERSLGEEIKAKMLEFSQGYPETVLEKRLAQLVSAGAFLEQKGIAYRNISDESIRVTADGGLKIFDFGHAREWTQEGAQLTTLLKTEQYMSPKMRAALIQGERNLLQVKHDIFKSDVYSVGVLMLYMSALEIPSFITSLQNLDFNIKQFLRENSRLKNYSQKWILLLQQMLEVEEERRPLFTKLEDDLGTLKLYADDQAIPVVMVKTTEALQWSLKCGVSSVRVGPGFSEPFPFLVTLKASPQAANLREVTWDFLCLVDQSGSMADYMRLVKKTIEAILSRLGERDRICLVSFSDEAKRYFPFFPCIRDNKRTVLESVNSLEALDSSDFIKGLDLAGCVLRQRRSKNSKTALLVFTDGMYQTDTEGVGYSSLKKIATEFPVYILQYGGQTEFSEQFAGTDSGLFQCIQTELDIQRALDEVLPSLSPVVARDICVKIDLQNDSTLQCVLEDTLIDSPSQIFSLSMLSEGEQAYFIFQVKASLKDLNSPMRFDAVKVSLTFKNSQGEIKSLISQKFGVTFVSLNSAPSPQVEEVNAAFLRAKAARSVRDAKKKAKMGKWQEVKNLLGNRISEVEQAEYLQHHRWIKDALRDLRQAKQSLLNSDCEECDRFPSDSLAFIESSSNR